MTLYDHPRLRELLAAILADPGSDVVRLAYADALDELGDGDRTAQEQAEFVRVQCELTSFKSPWGNEMLRHQRERLGALRRREAELLTATNFWRWFEPAFRPAWTGSPSAQVKEGRDVCVTYGQPGDDRQWYVSVRRGFVEGLTLPAADWLAHADAITAAQPVTAVMLTTWPDPAELTALTIRRGKQPGVADTVETSATRWCLRRLWPGVTFTLPVT